MKTEKFILPTWAASYLINSDCSGLEEEDILTVDKFVDQMLKVYPKFYCVEADVENHYFSAYNDMTGYKLGDEVCEYTFITE